MDQTVIIKNFVSDEDCDLMINRLNKLKQSNDLFVRDDGRIGIINKDDLVFNIMVDKYKNKTIKIFNNEYINLSGYIATIYNEGIGMNTHTDSENQEEFGVLMYLNDDYEGGELTYTNPDGEFKVVAPQKGDMVYCPSWYPHGVNKVTKGTRYFFTVSLMNHI